MSPSFADLKYFVVVADAANFSHAAKQLGLTQPSLSLAINRLEKSLKTELFIRHRKGVTLTLAGKQLYSHADALLEKWQATTTSIQAIQQDVSGKVKIGCHATHAPYVSLLTAKLLAEYPQLQLHFHHDQSVNTLQKVVDGVLDIGIVNDPATHLDLVMRKIYNSGIAIWQHVDFHMTESATVFGDAQLNHINSLVNAYRKNYPASRFCNVNNFEMIGHMILNKAGVGVMPACYVESQFSGKMRRIDNSPEHFSELYLIYRNENRFVEAQRVVLKAIDACIEEMD